jgi:hypothetical protein
MEMDVYFLCPDCNGLTNGKGSGDSPNDEITCTNCGKAFSAGRLGKLKPWTGKEVPERYLYIKSSNASNYV